LPRIPYILSVSLCVDYIFENTVCLILLQLFDTWLIFLSLTISIITTLENISRIFKVARSQRQQLTALYIVNTLNLSNQKSHYQSMNILCERIYSSIEWMRIVKVPRHVGRICLTKNFPTSRILKFLARTTLMSIAWLLTKPKTKHISVLLLAFNRRLASICFNKTSLYISRPIIS
jgi:hypothetical protein